MTSETPCMPDCIGGTDHDAQRTYVIHAEACPNAPKPAQPPVCFCGGRAVLGPVPQDGGDAEVQYTHATGCPKDAGPKQEPQSEPPIDYDSADSMANIHLEKVRKQFGSCDTVGFGNLARAYLSLKAELGFGNLARAYLSDHIKKLADARAKLKAQAEEIERLKGDLQEAKHFSSMLTAALENRNEELKDLANRLKHRCFRYHIEDGVQLAKELAQVETLRAALAGVLPGIDEAWALWPEGQNAVLKARAALAATDPKG